MRMTPQFLSPALAALALLLTGAGSGLAQETAGKVMMPWQKPQPKASAPSSFTDILPWLLSESGSKAQPQNDTASAWETKIDQPDEPREPTIEDWVEQGARIETGAISSTGLVLKKPLPPVNVKSDGKPQFKGAVEAGSAAAGASPSPKIKNSIQLPGDRPVGQADAAEVDANAADVAAPSAAQDAPAVQAQLASPVAADEAAAPAPAEQSLHTAVPGSEGVTPVEQRADTATTPAAPAEAHAVTAPFSPVRPVTPRMPVAKPGKSAAAATPVAAAADATATSAAEPTQTAQATEIPPVDPVPAMPQAEEAPPIPDALPEALVTPVAKPVAAECRSTGKGAAGAGSRGRAERCACRCSGSWPVAIEAAAARAARGWRKRRAAILFQHCRCREGCAVCVAEKDARRYRAGAEQAHRSVGRADGGIPEVADSPR